MISPCYLCIPLNFFFFFAVRVVSKDSRPLILPRTSYYKLITFNIAKYKFLPYIICRLTRVSVRHPSLSLICGRAIAQTARRWLPTAAARVQTRVQSCGICGGQSVAGAGFLRVLRFPLPTFIPPISPQSPSPIIRGWYNRPVVAAVPTVPPHKLKKKLPSPIINQYTRN
jgi:hypothetical protein